MVIKMKSDKSLIIRPASTKIYQGEQTAESIIFYVPKYYYFDTVTYRKRNDNTNENEDNCIDLSEYKATLYYSNSANQGYIETLVSIESDKTGCLMYKLPVSTKLTAIAGDVEMALAFTKVNETTGQMDTFESGTLKIKIHPWGNNFKIVDGNTLSSLSDAITQLEFKASQLRDKTDQMEDEIPNDLVVSDDILQLVRNEEDDEGVASTKTIGVGVEILVAGNDDTQDTSHDGIIDLTEIDPDEDEDEDKPDISPRGLYTFINLIDPD